MYAIAHNETKTFLIEKGQHVLTARLDWCRSNKLPFTIIPGETTVVETGSPFDYEPKPVSWLWDVGILLVPFIISYFFGDEMILWMGVSFILIWMAWLLFIKKRKPLLYYLTFGYREYLFLRLSHQ
jgi:hypothetical protein